MKAALEGVRVNTRVNEAPKITAHLPAGDGDFVGAWALLEALAFALSVAGEPDAGERFDQHREGLIGAMDSALRAGEIDALTGKSKKPHAPPMRPDTVLSIEHARAWSSAQGVDLVGPAVAANDFVTIREWGRISTMLQAEYEAHLADQTLRWAKGIYTMEEAAQRLEDLNDDVQACEVLLRMVELADPDRDGIRRMEVLHSTLDRVPGYKVTGRLCRPGSDWVTDATMLAFAALVKPEPWRWTANGGGAPEPVGQAMPSRVEDAAEGGWKVEARRQGIELYVKMRPTTTPTLDSLATLLSKTIKGTRGKPLVPRTIRRHALYGIMDEPLVREADRKREQAAEQMEQTKQGQN